MSPVRSNPPIYSREYYAHFYILPLFFFPFSPMAFGPSPGDPVLSELFRFTSRARRNPRFVSRPLQLPFTVLSRLSSRSLFALFRPAAVTIVPPLSPLSVVFGQTNAEAVLHVSEARGGARVPGSHLITHLSLSRENGCLTSYREL